MAPAVATPGNVPAGGGGGPRTSWGWIQPRPSLAWAQPGGARCWLQGPSTLGSAYPQCPRQEICQRGQFWGGDVTPKTLQHPQVADKQHLHCCHLPGKVLVISVAEGPPGSGIPKTPPPTPPGHLLWHKPLPQRREKKRGRLNFEV